MHTGVCSSSAAMPLRGGSCSRDGTRPALTAAFARARSRGMSRACAQAPSWPIRCANETSAAASFVASRGPWSPPPQPARTATTATRKLGRLVRVLLGGELERRRPHGVEMALLDRQRPLDELLHLGLAGALVQCGEDLPVADLTGLRHRQELEPVERVGGLVEVALHHLLRLLLHLARLVEDRSLLAVERAGDLGAALLGF